MNSRERDGWLDHCKLVRLLEGVITNLVYNSRQIANVIEIVCFRWKLGNGGELVQKLGRIF